MIAGQEAARPGEAKNSWLTGTAAWTWFAATQYILGLRADWDGLLIDPCIPRDWPGFKVTRVYRGITYEIDVKGAELSKGVAEIRVDGTVIDGCILPLFEPGTAHQVEVTMGKKE